MQHITRNATSPRADLLRGSPPLQQRTSHYLMFLHFRVHDLRGIQFVLSISTVTLVLLGPSLTSLTSPSIAGLALSHFQEHCGIRVFDQLDSPHVATARVSAHSWIQGTNRFVHFARRFLEPGVDLTQRKRTLNHEITFTGYWPLVFLTSGASSSM